MDTLSCPQVVVLSLSCPQVVAYQHWRSGAYHLPTCHGSHQLQREPDPGAEGHHFQGVQHIERGVSGQCITPCVTPMYNEGLDPIVASCLLWYTSCVEDRSISSMFLLPPLLIHILCCPAGGMAWHAIASHEVGCARPSCAGSIRLNVYHVFSVIICSYRLPTSWTTLPGYMHCKRKSRVRDIRIRYYIFYSKLYACWLLCVLQRCTSLECGEACQDPFTMRALEWVKHFTAFKQAVC